MKSHNIIVKARCAYKTKNGQCKRITSITHPYCAQHTLQETGLYVETSGIPNAGLGLYTSRDIPKGTCITEYKGTKLSVKEFNEKYGDDGYGAYALGLNRTTVIDACKTSDCLARYICDFTGSGKKPNVKFEVDKGRVEVTALRKIYAGEELLVDYGDEMREAMGIQPPKKKKKKAARKKKA